MASVSMQRFSEHILAVGYPAARGDDDVMTLHDISLLYGHMTLKFDDVCYIALHDFYHLTLQV